MQIWSQRRQQSDTSDNMSRGEQWTLCLCLCQLSHVGTIDRATPSRQNAFCSTDNTTLNLIRSSINEADKTSNALAAPYQWCVSISCSILSYRIYYLNWKEVVEKLPEIKRVLDLTLNTSAVTSFYAITCSGYLLVHFGYSWQIMLFVEWRIPPLGFPASHCRKESGRKTSREIPLVSEMCCHECHRDMHLSIIRWCLSLSMVKSFQFSLTFRYDPADFQSHFFAYPDWQ